MWPPAILPWNHKYDWKKYQRNFSNDRMTIFEKSQVIQVFQLKRFASGY